MCEIDHLSDATELFPLTGNGDRVEETHPIRDE